MSSNFSLNIGLFAQAHQASRRLTVFRHFLTDPIFQNFIRLLDLAGAASPDAGELTDLYHYLVGQLATASESACPPIVGDAWQNYLLDLILDAENPFTRQAELGPNVKGSLLEAARNDLQCLEQLFRLDTRMVRQTIAEIVNFLPSPTDRQAPVSPVSEWPLWDNFYNQARNSLVIPNSRERWQIKQLLFRTIDWRTCLDDLISYYTAGGVGLFGRYRAFRWVRHNSQSEFQPVPEPDPVRLDDLIGYEAEKNEIRRNTEKLLRGYPANNILLYGDRGTGKSSTVKALVNEYGDQGLRLIEVPKQYLTDFPVIIQHLRRRPQCFILFVDDLSFEEHEVEYKDLKAILEGGLESRPSNVLIYATSNRRHLIKERLSDRQITAELGADDEVRRNDTVQEKLSLADRFGMTIIFPSPDQDRYLAIVEGLAKQRGLRISRDDLRRRALQWEVWHNGRSGRTARQFIDHLTGELALDVY
ncbi:MAG: ATP-binding protein [Firmicutes bacterium]|nr:ATP-binding protein [Bacillota bacterium]